ncbi:MAG: OsmC family protein [bacterium]|jgi:putative redox protein|nr:OsmC family protein [bacterium]
MSVQIDIVYEGQLHCHATHAPSGNTLITDAPVDNGGRGVSFSPTDLVATALGSCMVTIMGLAAEQEQIDLSGTKIQVHKDMVADPKRRIGSLKTTVTIPGGSKLTPKQKTKLENAAATCPVKQSLHPDIAIPVEFIYLD